MDTLYQHLVQREMAAYDSLPRRVREAVGNAGYQFSTCELAVELRKHQALYGDADGGEDWLAGEVERVDRMMAQANGQQGRVAE